jgi:hypothetical protein
MSELSEKETHELWVKFVGPTPPTPAVPKPPVTPAAVFMPSAAETAAFAAEFGLTAASLTGDAPEQAALTAADQTALIPWPRIPALTAPYDLAAVQRYQGQGYRPDGTHSPVSKADFNAARHLVALLAAPETNTPAQIEAILTGAGAAKPAAVAGALLNGLVPFKGLGGSPSYGGWLTPEDVIAALTALPAPEVVDPSKPPMFGIGH